MSNKQQTITSIFSKIDDLDDSRNLKELIAKIQPILAELAYYSITGDGAVMEMRENWHSNFTGYIKEAIQTNDGGASMGGGLSASMSASMSGEMNSGGVGGERYRGGERGGEITRRGERPRSERRGVGEDMGINRDMVRSYDQSPQTVGYYQQPTFYNKKKSTESIPSSLENIMRGTHISFSNN